MHIGRKKINLLLKNIDHIGKISDSDLDIYPDLSP